MKINGQTFHETFTIKMDPKVAKSGITLAEIKAQEALNLKVRTQRNLAKQTLANIEKNKEKLSTIPLEQQTKAQQKQIEQLDNLIRQFVTEKGRYQKPMLLDQFRYLNYMIDAADQQPGDDAIIRLNELSGLLKKHIAAYRKVAGVKEEMGD